MPANFADLEKKSLRAAEQDRPDVARHRSRWRVWQRYMDGERFVFIDETAPTTAMTPHPRAGAPPLRLGPKGRAPGRCGAGGSLEDHDRRGGPASERDHRTFCARWAHDRGGVPGPRRGGAPPRL